MNDRATYGWSSCSLEGKNVDLLLFYRHPKNALLYYVLLPYYVKRNKHNMSSINWSIEL
jgi:hypothetical protein